MILKKGWHVEFQGEEERGGSFERNCGAEGT